MAKILVVDDSVFVRNRLSSMLRDWGHEPIEACDGRQAVEAYSRERPDIVLLDITMPVLDGLQSLGQILAQDPDACVAMVSALGSKETIMQAIKAGARDFVVKPFDASRIKLLVDRLTATAAGS
jgi:two-component system chemotaxis response regulator CheY